MKTINIALYSIDELSQEAQEKAFERYRHFNVEDNTWYEGEFDDFVSLCKTIGIDIPANGISFSGFWSQGDGSTFASTINAEQLIKGIGQEAWKDYAPKLDFNFKPCPCDKRVLALISKGYIEYQLSTETPKRGYYIEFWADYSFIPNRGNELTNIENELAKLDKWIEHCLKLLNRHLYKSLEEQYEYETTDETIKETFMANDYLFTADGKKADRLLNFTIE